MKVRLFLIVFILIGVLNDGSFAQSDTIFLERWYFYKQGIVGVFDIEGNFNPGRYKWSILTPSQTPIPGLSNYVDPNEIRPIPEVTPHLGTPNLANLKYRKCHDSDRCEFFFPRKESGAAKRLLIRLAGIRTPNVKASCEQEAFLGKTAIDLIQGYLSSAVQIEVRNFSKRGGEIKGRVVADGQDLSELLVNQGLAVTFERNKKDWCS